MNDLAILALIVVYAGLGYWTGIIRRVIGFAALYVGFFAATSTAPTAATVVLSVFPTWAVPDALTAGYFLVVVIVLVLVEVLVTFWHSQLQLAAILVDRGSGAIVGALTAIVGVTVALVLLLGASQPVQGSPDGAQIQTHDAITKSALGPVLVNALGPAVKLIFLPVIPNDPATYFNAQEARVQH
jgi:uncharacterized membrane protein required for colicin V production